MTEPAPPRRPPVVLVANSEEWSTRSIESVIASEGYHVIRARTGQQVFQQTEASDPDAVLLNASMPDMEGVAVCRELRRRRLASDSTPIIMMAGSLPSHDVIIDALAAGAWDVLSMPLDADVLVAKIRVYVKAHLEAESAHETSLLDSESGLYNLTGILRQVGQLGNDAARHQRAIACVVVAAEPVESPDLPGPGLANGSGYAARLRELTRGSDAVGRVGRHEFIVVAPDTGPPGVLKLAERLTQSIAEGRDAEAPAGVRVRAGCFAVGNMENAKLQPTDLLVRATMALRNAQADTSGPRIRFYDDGAETTTTSLA